MFALQVAMSGLPNIEPVSLLTMVYAVGGISGGHFNPAVSVGLLVGGRFEAKELVPYIIAQVVGAILACMFM